MRLKYTTLITILLAIVNINNPSIAQINFTKHIIDGNFDGVYCIYAMDIDGDDDVDVVCGATSSDQIAWWENDGNQNFTKHIIGISIGPVRSVYAIDIDGDDDVDIIAAVDDKVVWWENDGNQNFLSHNIETGFWNTGGIYALDIDEDTDIDLINGSYNIGSIGELVWWENDGNQSFTKHVVDGNFPAINTVYALDIDNDIDIDIIASAESYGISWWENDGNQNFTKHIIEYPTDGAKEVYALDLDNDDDVDILGAVYGDSQIAWWENDGNQSYTKHVVDGNFSGAASVYALDIDNDIDIDIIGAALSIDEVAWWENDGNQSYTKHVVDGNFNKPYQIYATDVNGDGLNDILGIAFDDDDVAWWENLGGPVTQITINAPNGGENWQLGTQHSIMWVAENVDFVNIEYSVDAGITWEPPIATNYDAALESYPWTIPNTPSNNCLVRILDSSNPEVGDTSDGTFIIFPEVTLTSYDIFDHLKEILEAGGLENLFQKIYDLIVRLVFPGPTPVTTDATLSLEFSDNSLITNVFCHFYSPDDPQFDQTLEFMDVGNGIYSLRIMVEPTTPLSISTFFDMLQFMLKGSPINPLPPQIGASAPRAILDQIEIQFQGGSNQIINENIELPRYDRIIYEHLEYLTGSEIYGYNELIVASPVNLFLIDSAGNRVGSQGGVEYYEIPYAIYTGDEEPEAIALFGEEDYDLFIYGTATGSFDYTFTQNWIENDTVGNSAFYEDVSVEAISICSTKTGAYIQEYLIYMDYDGDGVYESTIYPTILTNVENDILATVIPTEYSIEQNYPNPFNPSTRIKYSIPEESLISIKIYNTLGEEIAELVSGSKSAGSYGVEFDASRLPSGIYFYRLQAGSFFKTKKMIYLK